MIVINGILIALIFIASYVAAYLFYKQKRWIGFAIVVAFLIRIHAAVILAGGLQYSFVLDSLEYEMKAWYLIQPWMNESLRISFNPGHINNYNPYDYLLAAFFYVFGKGTLLAPLSNCLLATLTILFMTLLQKDFLYSSLGESQCRGIMLCTVILVAIYPSYIIWSATNIRDPLYLLSCLALLYFLMSTFSLKQKLNVFARGGYFVLAVLALALVIGLRGYIGWLLLASLVAGILLYLLVRGTGSKGALVGATVSSGVFLYFLMSSYSAQVSQALGELTNVRRAFSNANFADIYARSSFGLEQSFQSPADVAMFLPNALAHYFFGPFLWEISDTVQALSFLETLFIMLLVPATVWGVRRSYRREPLVSILLLAFVFVFSCSQALVISNMGTLFRHRTLSILILFMFSGEGVYAYIEKNRPSLLTA